MTARTRTTLMVTSLALVALACGDESDPAPTTTTGTALPPRTTLPQVVTTAPAASTTTTAPAEVALAVDACGLVEPSDVQPVAGEDPGPGRPVAPQDTAGGSAVEAAPPPTGEGGASPATLLLSTCQWPTEGSPVVTLSYLAPTTAGAALEHLQRLVDLDSSFARGARVFPLPPQGDLGPAALVDPDGGVTELAVVSGSALIYVVPRDPPQSGSPEADALVSLLLAAAGRAPG